jgi:hypothetical protein
VFEDNTTLSSRFNQDTQNYLSQRKLSDSQGQETINVKIEAPVILFKEESRLWIIDLGNFDIMKAGSEQASQKAAMIFEGKKARVFYAESGMDLRNLNELVAAPDLFDDIETRMSLVISDLEFTVDLFKTEVVKEEGLDLVDNLNFTIHPFKINLSDSALRSMFTLVLMVNQETKREKAFIDRIMKKGDVLTITQKTEYDIGYEVWEESDVILEGQYLYIVSRENKLLASQDLSKISSMGLESMEDSFWKLTLSSSRKRISFRSTNRDFMSQIKFRIQSVLSLIENQESMESTSKSFSTDFIVSLQFTEIVLILQNYARDVTPFEITLRGLDYSSEVIDGVETGNLQFIECLVSDHSEGFPIFNFESGRDVALPGMVYHYRYKEGIIDSTVKLCNIELAYKVEYVQSLMKLIEIVVEYLTEDKKSSSDSAPRRKLSQEQIILDDPIIRKSTTKQKLNLSCNCAKIDLYFKKTIKSVTLTGSNFEIELISQGLNNTVMAKMKNILLVSHMEYPYRKNGPLLRTPCPLLYLKDTGGISFTLIIKELEEGKGRVSRELNCAVLDPVIEWVHQPMLRFTDFVLYQVVEIFYPSLLSFSKYYNPENLIKQALLDLNDDTFLKQNHTISNLTVHLPSTVDYSKKLSVKADQVLVLNNRGHLNKTANFEKLKYFPLGELESDLWNIDLKNVDLSMIQRIDDQPCKCLAEQIDLNVQVHYLTKLFELSFLYDIENDILCFDETASMMVKKYEQLGYSLTKKISKDLAELKLEAREFIKRADRKEKIMVDDRYHITISTKSIKLLLTNQLINMLSEISSNNLSFDDGMDGYLSNAYVNNTKVISV